MRLQNFWTARALTYDANGNTYLTLAAPASADKFTRAFTSATTQLADRPLTEQVLRDAGTGQVNFNGILADEIRMAGSDEDRAAVVALATAYQRYLQADKAVRDAAAHSGLGDPAFVQAQRQLTSAFSQLDWRLGVVIQNQQSEFDGDMSAGALTLEVAGVITVLAGLVALLAYWGLRPRMAEYTAGASASQSTSRPESRPHPGVLEAG
jgi:hypothetical protein